MSIVAMVAHLSYCCALVISEYCSVVIIEKVCNNIWLS